MNNFHLIVPQVSFFGNSLASGLEAQNISKKFAVRAAAATEAPKKKESKKADEGISINVFKPKEPYIGRTLLNTKIVGDDAPGETWHMVFTTEGKESRALFR